MTDSVFLFILNPDGLAIIGYEDYDVNIFDGDDYEVTYLLDTKKQLKKEFGQHFDSRKFEEFCEEHNIRYERNVRIG